MLSFIQGLTEMHDVKFTRLKFF